MILIVTIVVFCLLHALPGGPARGILGPQATARADRRVQPRAGPRPPLPVQYAPLPAAAAARRPRHLVHPERAGLAAHRAAPAEDPRPDRAVRARRAAARRSRSACGRPSRRNRPVDYVITTLSFVAYSTPVYFLGLMLVLVFTQLLPLVPVAGAAGRHAGRGVRATRRRCAADRRRGRRPWSPCSAGYMRSADAGEPLRGLRPHRPGRRRTAARRPAAARVPQLAHARRRDARLLRAGAVRRRARRRAALQLPRHGAAVLERRAVLRLSRSCSAASSSSPSRPSSARCSPTSCSGSIDPRVKAGRVMSAVLPDRALPPRRSRTRRRDGACSPGAGSAATGSPSPGWRWSLLFLLFCFVGPAGVLHRPDPHRPHRRSTCAPARRHLLGTDAVGHDELGRLMYGGQSRCWSASRPGVARHRHRHAVGCGRRATRAAGSTR